MENLFLQSCVLCHVLDRLRAMLDFCQNCLKLPYQNYSYRCITQSCVYRDQKQVYCTASDWCLQKLSWLQFGVNLLCTYNVLRILDYSECGDHIYIYGNYTWFNREFLDEWQKASSCCVYQCVRREISCSRFYSFLRLKSHFRLEYYRQSKLHDNKLRQHFQECCFVHEFTIFNHLIIYVKIILTLSKCTNALTTIRWFGEVTSVV
ncbi:Hypothetical_protein [Hexamita inflata]|uniref:Hypothetical_protein n=1 Tax=Hexamita inflata TaxID=28002 RepID=A0AA86VKX2_9EUKA|nr:Hypothetical protein HINF_LOCUS57258 [Hexamita inflata]